MRVKLVKLAHIAAQQEQLQLVIVVDAMLEATAQQGLVLKSPVMLAHIGAQEEQLQLVIVAYVLLEAIVKKV